MTDAIGYERVGDIAVLKAQNPPVNALGLDVRQGLVDGIERAESEGAKAVLVGGVESISMVQPPVRHSREAWIEKNKPELYLSMIETADIVARRYGISREAQDELGLQSRQKAR